MSMRTFLVVLGLLMISQTAAAQPSDELGFGFLRLEPSARAAALGGSFSAVYGDDVNALFYNPALLNEDMHGALSVSYLNHLSDINAGFLAYSRHYEQIGSIGAGLRFMGWGELQGADEQGNRTGTFSASDVALTVGAARTYAENWQYGVNAHLIYSSLDDVSASALAADVGVLYRLPDQQLTLSAAVTNLGVTLNSFGATKDELPMDVRIGLTKRLRYLPLLVSVMGYNLHDMDRLSETASTLDDVLAHLALGGEFQFGSAFNVRVGYNHRRHEELKTKSRLDLAGFGMGFGLKITRFNFDYAYNSWSENGGLHQLTVRTVL